jgi:large subunit ribosomal protein L13
MKPNSTTIERSWHHIDAKGKVLGRLATGVATLLRGKHKVSFRPHLDVGDLVVVTNAKDIVVTGAKETEKLYIHHTGYPRGFRSKTLKAIRAEKPEMIVQNAVAGMLPKTLQRDIWMKRLKVYAGPEHPHKTNINQRPKNTEQEIDLASTIDQS